MSLDLLDTPLRATWHLDALEGALCEKEVRLLATRLGDAGLFHLETESFFKIARCVSLNLDGRIHRRIDYDAQI